MANMPQRPCATIGIATGRNPVTTDPGQGGIRMPDGPLRPGLLEKPAT